MDDSEVMNLSRQLQASLYASSTGDSNSSFSQQDRQRLLILLRAQRATAVKQEKTNRQNKLFELPPLYRQ
jgi:hypothetical protein